MKHLAGLHNDTVELEVYECDCGFHIGLDATYLDQVNEIEIRCPSCGEWITTEENRRKRVEPMTIPAEVHSDDHEEEAEFDALGWVKTASVDELYELADCGFGGDYAADAVAESSKKIFKVRQVFSYLNRMNRRQSAPTIGFECHVEKGPLMAWLKKNRSVVYKKIQKGLKIS